MDIPRICVDFTLFGNNLDFEQINESLQLKPNQTWRKGETIARSIMTHKQDGWRISTGYAETLEVDRLVTRLLERISPAHANLEMLYGEMQLAGELSIVVYIHQSTPVFGLSAIQLQQIAALHCSIDVDIIQC